MTIIKNSSQIKNILSGILVTTMLVTFYSCAKKSAAVAKTEVPAVVETPAATTVPVENKGQVQIKRDATGNYVIYRGETAIILPLIYNFSSISTTFSLLSMT